MLWGGGVIISKPSLKSYINTGVKISCNFARVLVSWSVPEKKVSDNPFLGPEKKVSDNSISGHEDSISGHGNGNSISGLV